VQVRVLVAEDHVGLANRVGEGLRDAGAPSMWCNDGAAGVESTTSTGYDVVVFDRDLPEVADWLQANGFDLLPPQAERP
jgi:DNA-binding response OmpR family regulator